MTMITTTKGLIHESLLIKKEMQEKANPAGILNIIEYWLPDKQNNPVELVHRSLHLDLSNTVLPS
jgi:hypothetical protein